MSSFYAVENKREIQQKSQREKEGGEMEPLLCVDAPDADLAVVECRLLSRELFIRASAAVHRPEPEPEMRIPSAAARRGEGRERSKGFSKRRWVLPKVTGLRGRKGREVTVTGGGGRGRESTAQDGRAGAELTEVAGGGRDGTRGRDLTILLGVGGPLARFFLG
jgi:hypothetical protein